MGLYLKNTVCPPDDSAVCLVAENCSVVNDADVCDIVGSVVTDAVLCADCVVTNVICVGVCGGKTTGGVDCVVDSVVGGKACVGTIVETVCVVDAVAIGGIVCVVVVTDPLDVL